MATDPTTLRTIKASETLTMIRAGRCIARGKRVTNSTGTTTEQGVLRLDGVPVKTGRLYRIYTNFISVDSSVANDVISGKLRYTTDGTNATTSSTLLSSTQHLQANATAGEHILVDEDYTPGSDVNLSILLTCSRAVGSGTVAFLGGSTGNPPPISLYVVDMGEDPGDTGVDI